MPIENNQNPSKKDLKKLAASFAEKYFEDNYLLPWFCWGMDLLFKDKAYIQMLEIIDSIDKDLDKYLDPIEPSKEDIENLVRQFNLKNKNEVIGKLTFEVFAQPNKVPGGQTTKMTEGALCLFCVTFKPVKKSPLLNKDDNKLPTRLYVYTLVNPKYKNGIIRGIEEGYDPSALIGSKEDKEKLLETLEPKQVFNFIELYLGPAMPLDDLPIASTKDVDKLLMLLEFLDTNYFFN